MPDVLKNFLQNSIWAACKKWFNEEKAEFADLLKTFKEMSKFHRLLL